MWGDICTNNKRVLSAIQGVSCIGILLGYWIGDWSNCGFFLSRPALTNIRKGFTSPHSERWCNMHYGGNHASVWMKEHRGNLDKMGYHCSFCRPHRGENRTIDNSKPKKKSIDRTSIRFMCME